MQAPDRGRTHHNSGADSVGTPSASASRFACYIKNAVTRGLVRGGAARTINGFLPRPAAALPSVVHARRCLPVCVCHAAAVHPHDRRAC